MLQKAETIYHKANELVRRCGTRDTLRIAGKIGIYIHQIDTFKELLGMYSYQHKERHILLNSNMDYIYSSNRSVDMRSVMIFFIGRKPRAEWAPGIHPV